MRAIVVDPLTQELRWQEAEEPACGDTDVLIDVFAAGVNRADLMQRAGKYPAPPGVTDILGLEVSGVVAATGSGVRAWRAGDRLCALLPGGGYAERVAVHESLLFRVPPHWTFHDAAGFPEAFLTAFLNLFLEAGMRRNDCVLVHGGASGVGTAAIQLVHAAGGRAFATAGSQRKRDACISLGAERAVEHYHSDFALDLLQTTDGMDIVLDIGGARYLDRNLKLLRLGGRLILIALWTGSKAEIDLARMMQKRLRVIGSTLRSRPTEEKAAALRAFEKRFGALVESDRIRPVIDRVLPIHRADEAHEVLRRNENIGKVILSIKE
jgi:putative PIG3 family NAD(P)H quinone oxidoreductase